MFVNHRGFFLVTVCFMFVSGMDTRMCRTPSEVPLCNPTFRDENVGLRGVFEDKGQDVRRVSDPFGCNE